MPTPLPPLSVKDFDKAHPYILLPKEVAPRGPLRLAPTYAKERAILDDMFDFDAVFSGRGGGSVFLMKPKNKGPNSID